MTIQRISRPCVDEAPDDPILGGEDPWTCHDKGLVRWCDAGMPVEDDRLALIRDVWVADGLLDRHIAWCVQHSVHVMGN